ncbi:MAG: hypothetical protein CXT77_03850 [uncultured DHVE6 group euryarchaeote]|nr:MAG: hypothetical protein CXT77_03850 [uncultured DHVE6 group euryarchaeote]
MVEKIQYSRNLKIYWNFVKKYKFLLVMILLVLIVMQSLSLVIPYLLKLLIDNGELFLNGKITQIVFSKILLTLLAVYVGSEIIRSASEWFRHAILIKLDSRIIKDLKIKYFNHLIDLSHGFHSSNKTGTLISRIIRGGSSIESLNDSFAFNFIPLLIRFIVIGTALYFVDWKLPIIMTLFILLFISINYFLLKAEANSRMRSNKAEDKERANIADTFTNIDSIKYFGKEQKIKSVFSKLVERTRKELVKTWSFYKIRSTINIFITGLSALIILSIPIFGLLNKTTSIGTLVFVWGAYGKILNPLHGFIFGMRRVYRSMTDLEKLFNYSDIKNEIKDAPNAKRLEIKQGKVEFKNINFGYRSETRIFENFNLKIGKNQKIALVGLSGAGKSTLIKLLYRFYDPDFGQVLIDGTDIKEFKQESVRSEMSIVPQEAILFDDTIYNNIAFSKTNASNKEVWKAIKFAQLEDFINGLPEKGNTIVGERGVKLSGGEKQRVSIARAILANKKILVLDEATSAMDSETEFFIQSALKKLMKNRTTIIIAHRLSTIMFADKIVVIDKGKIKETGTHEELIKSSKIYKKLWTIQKGGYIK